jgi:hypothetical protein
MSSPVTTTWRGVVSGSSTNDNSRSTTADTIGGIGWEKVVSE